MSGSESITSVLHELVFCKTQRIKQWQMPYKFIANYGNMWPEITFYEQLHDRWGVSEIAWQKM